MPRSGAVRVAAASAARLVSGSETPGTARAEATREPRHFFHRWAFPWVSISRGSAQGREPSPSLAWLKTKSSSRSPRRVNPPHPSPALCGVPRAFFPSPWGSFAPRGAPGARLPAGSTAQAVLTGSIPAVGPPPRVVSPPLSPARCSQLSPRRRSVAPLTSLSCPRCRLWADTGGPPLPPVPGLPGGTAMILGRAGPWQCLNPSVLWVKKVKGWAGGGRSPAPPCQACSGHGRRIARSHAERAGRGLCQRWEGWRGCQTRGERENVFPAPSRRLCAGPG